MLKTNDTFEVKEEHLKLLQQAYVGMNESPFIYPYRPYGNSDIEGDIAEILGWEINEGEEERFTPEQKVLVKKLHQETAIALQICLYTQSFQVGTYRKCSGFDTREWVKV